MVRWHKGPKLVAAHPDQPNRGRFMHVEPQGPTLVAAHANQLNQGRLMHVEAQHRHEELLNQQQETEAAVRIVAVVSCPDIAKHDTGLRA